MEYSNAEIMDIGMNVLVKALGIVDAERFLVHVKGDDFDYTKWQREYFDAKTPEEIEQEAIAYSKSHPYRVPTT